MSEMLSLLHDEFSTTMALCGEWLANAGSMLGQRHQMTKTIKIELL